MRDVGNVFVKCEHMDPGGSVKDRIALAIVDDAEERRVLRSGMALMEATVGNTGDGAYAIEAAARGAEVTAVTSSRCRRPASRRRRRGQ